MFYTVYILKSLKTGRRYIGYTGDWGKRLLQHNRGENISTKSGVPWKMIYKEGGFKKKEDALRREQELKKMKGGVQLKEILETFEKTKEKE